MILLKLVLYGIWTVQCAEDPNVVKTILNVNKLLSGKALKHNRRLYPESFGGVLFKNRARSEQLENHRTDDSWIGQLLNITLEQLAYS